MKKLVDGDHMPNAQLLLLRQLGSATPRCFKKRALKWLYGHVATEIHINLQYLFAVNGQGFSRSLSRDEKEACHIKSLELDPVSSRYMLSGRMEGSIAIHDTHSTIEEVLVRSGTTANFHPLLSVARGGSSKTHVTKVNCVHWYKDCGLFTSSSAKTGCVKVWDPERMSVVEQFLFPSEMVAQHDIAPGNAVIAAAGVLGTIRLCDLRTGSSCQQLRERQPTAGSTVKWHPVNENVLAGGYQFGKVILWDVRSSKSFLGSFAGPTVSLGPGSKEFVGIHEPLSTPSSIVGLQFSSDGRQLLACRENDVQLWDPDQRRLLQPVIKLMPCNPSTDILREGCGAGPDARWSQDGSMVFACHEDYVLVLHPQSRRCVNAIRTGDIGYTMDEQQHRLFSYNSLNCFSRKFDIGQQYVSDGNQGEMRIDWGSLPSLSSPPAAEATVGGARCTSPSGVEGLLGLGSRAIHTSHGSTFTDRQASVYSNRAGSFSSDRGRGELGKRQHQDDGRSTSASEGNSTKKSRTMNSRRSSSNVELKMSANKDSSSSSNQGTSSSSKHGTSSSSSKQDSSSSRSSKKGTSSSNSKHCTSSSSSKHCTSSSSSKHCTFSSNSSKQGTSSSSSKHCTSSSSSKHGTSSSNSSKHGTSSSSSSKHGTSSSSSKHGTSSSSSKQGTSSSSSSKQGTSSSSSSKQGSSSSSSNHGTSSSSRKQGTSSSSSKHGTSSSSSKQDTSSSSNSSSSKQGTYSSIKQSSPVISKRPPCIIKQGSPTNSELNSLIRSDHHSPSTNMHGFPSISKTLASSSKQHPSSIDSQQRALPPALLKTSSCQGLPDSWSSSDED